MSNPNPNEVFTGGATTSQHIEAEDDDHFTNTTFKLKRTRSLGLLDEFINPLEKAKQDGEAENGSAVADEESSSPVPPIVKPLKPSTNNKITVNTTIDTNDTNKDSTDEHNNKLQKVVSPTFKSPEFIPHDDADIMAEPQIHVDYFSHQWDVSDISKSWRYVIQKRKDVANSARLENASWRTWAQRRGNLKTINPEELNWSKENDITWLYGPIVKDDPESSDDENDHKHSKHGSNIASSMVAGDISIPNEHKKGILKKRSVQDVMISHANLVKLEALENRIKMKKEQQREQLRKYNEQVNKRKGHSRNNSNEPPEFDDYEAISEKLNSQYRVSSNQSSSINLKALNQLDANSNNDVNDNKNTSNNSNDQINDSNINDLTNKLSQKISNIDLNEDIHSSHDSIKQEENIKKARSIHFNDVVEQCMALDDDYDSEINSDDDGDYDYYSDSHNGQQSYMYNPNELPNDDDYDYEAQDDDSEDEDDDGGFFLKVRSPSSSSLAPQFASKENQLKGDMQLSDRSVDRLSDDRPPSSQKTNDTESISTTNSKVYRTIQMLPPTSLNYGSDEETSDEENPYTSSLSHNVNNSSSRGFDYYYDYNTVYTVDSQNGIYGNNKNEGNVPDVVDLPEDLAPYSSYELTTDQHDGMPILDSQVITNSNIIYSNNNGSNEYSSSVSPISQVPPSLPTPRQTEGFSFNDSDSEDSSEDEGLSISTRSSSQSLAQQAYQHMTPIDNKTTDVTSSSVGYNPEPVSESISSINPRHSSTGLSKQSTSSNSLSNQFFGTTPLTKEPSSSALADLFFNSKSSSGSETIIQRPKASYPQRTQSKSSPLPPHTTSANAFLGNTTPPLETQRKASGGTFAFDSSDSEDEFIEDLDRDTHSPGSSSYNSLSQVAGKSGIGYNQGDRSDKTIVNQAKGIANHFLGNWKSDN